MFCFSSDTSFEAIVWYVCHFGMTHIAVTAHRGPFLNSLQHGIFLIIFISFAITCYFPRPGTCLNRYTCPFNSLWFRRSRYNSTRTGGICDLGRDFIAPVSSTLYPICF
ncbi:hypothetical protein DL95DRAFT_66578 [Leptodontidium sp. 2 PMI_412]|nr:hypothetical protein DL95DRAFT_66578 [Leptodontidium sp. 2 PMI_412]